MKKPTPYEKITLAIGKTINGKNILYQNNPREFFILKVENQGLIELDIFEKIGILHARGNYLKDIDLPETIRYITCDKELFDYEACKAKIVNIYYDNPND